MEDPIAFVVISLVVIGIGRMCDFLNYAVLQKRQIMTTDTSIMSQTATDTTEIQKY